MELNFTIKHRYLIQEETRIETENSAIYKAIDVEMGRNICVKQIRIQGANDREVKVNLSVALTEVKTMVEIGDQTSRVPTIYETYFDPADKMLYIIMQWIEGKDLSKLMNVPELQFIRWMISLCDILSIMENKKLYHKDIKPGNIRINQENELFLIDFNLSISTSNRVDGTLHYKAPEMDMNSKYMGRDKVDMFAIGVMLYEYYTKEVPKKTIDYAKNRQRGNFEWDVFIEPIEKNSSMKKGINDIIVRCMKLDAKQRYRNMNELKYELKNVERSLRSGRPR